MGAGGGPEVRDLAGEWRLADDNPNEWEWVHRARRRHDLAAWLPVQVPSSVQEALWRAGRLAHPYRDLRSRDAEWVEHRDWIYGRDLILEPLPAGRRAFLEFDAVDDVCEVYLNGARVGVHEGPGAPFPCEVGPALAAGANQLLVVIRAPRAEDPQTGRTERTRGLQGRMGYGWDFAPRLVRVGILGGVQLRQTGPHRLHDFWLRAEPAPDGRAATVALAVGVDGLPGARVRFAVGRGGREVAAAEAAAGADGLARATLDLRAPALWWPNGLGRQPLYRAVAACLDGSDRVETTFGVREIRWEGPAGTWPLTLVVNGRRLFQRGWNWVPADAMGGPRADRLAARLLRLARASGANILRCWGGADPETRAFYDACDRLGLLVWQEFPLSSAGISNVPPSDPAYLDRLARYARDVVAARRNHPGLALWGGGNELQEPAGRPLTPEHPYARTLAAVVAAEDPGRAFRPGSPLGPTFAADPAAADLWDVHGPWEYGADPPGPQYARFNAIRPLLHSELGAPGEASLAAQRRWLSPGHRSRRPGAPARRHHGGAWWEDRATVDALFGPIADDDLAVLASQWLQAEALRYYVEESRRRWPRTAGIFPWQFDEPWPNAVCTSAVEYGGRPKLAYYAVCRAYRPALVTARYASLTVAPGGPLADLWALNDGAPLAADLLVILSDLAGNTVAAPAPCPVALPAGASTPLGIAAPPLPPDFVGVAILDVALAGHPETANRYLFATPAPAPLRPALASPDLLRAMFA